MDMVWVVQVVLAALFLGAGMVKLTQPRERLAAGQMGWAVDFTDGQVRGIGALEVLAAIGLIVPAAIDVLPAVTAFAAIGVTLIMIGAARTHLSRGEIPMIFANLGIMALALFVAVEFLG